MPRKNLTRKKRGEPWQQTLLATLANMPWRTVAILALSVLLAYANSFVVPLLFDDFLSIKDNASVHQLWPPWIPLLPPASAPTGGRPILNLSFALNYALGGFNTFGYHAVNYLIHVLAGLTLFGIVRRTLLQPALREKFGRDAAPLALAVALLWTLHPLQTEAVTYISERAESLMGLFYLLTLYAFIRVAEEKPGPARRNWSIACVIACFFGLGTKEVMVTAPLLVLLYDRTFIAGNFREALQRRGWIYAGLAASWVLLALSLPTVNQRAVGVNLGVPPLTYAVTECGVVFHYLRLVFWPYPLIFDYGAPVPGDFWIGLMPKLIVLALVILTLVAVVRWPLLGFAGAWFFVILAPTSSFIPVAMSPIAEHRLYLPLAAPVTLAVLGLYAWLGRRCLNVTLVLAIVLGLLTFTRNADYRSGVVLWQQVVNDRPDNPRAHESLGEALIGAGDVKDAETELRRALELFPELSDNHSNLGNLLLQEGRLDEAMAEYRQAVDLSPSAAGPHCDIANVLSQQGKLGQALAEYQTALQLDPRNTSAIGAIGAILDRQGHTDDAISRYLAVLEIDPGDAGAHAGLGEAFAHKGQLDAALAECQKAVQLNPTDAGEWYNMGEVLSRMSQDDDAIAAYRKSIELNPAFADVHYNLARILVRQQQMHDATDELSAALRLKPDDIDATIYLGIVQAQVGRYDEAIATFQKAQALDPKNAEVHNDWGITLAMMGRTAEAAAQFHEALKLNPDYVQAQQNLIRLNSPTPPQPTGP